MENVDISEWVKSALVIDDKWGEVKGLIRTLNSRGVSTSYYNPNPQQDFLLEEFGVSIPEDLEEAEKHILTAKLEEFIRSSLADFSIPQLAVNSVTGYNLIFLDINFGFDAAAGNIKSQVNLAVQLFANALSDQSTPYGVVLWSKDSRLPYDGDDGQGESTFEYIKNLLYKVALPGKPKPLFVIDLDKSLFWEDTDYSALANALKQELYKDNMAKFFAYWNKEVLQSAASTCKTIQNYAEVLLKERQNKKDENAASTASVQEKKDEKTEKNSTSYSLEQEFFNILKYLTYNHFGFPRDEHPDMTKILSRYSFSYMSNQLYDALHSGFCRKELNVFDSPKDYLRENISQSGVDIIKHYNELSKAIDSYKPLTEGTQQELRGAIEGITTQNVFSLELCRVLSEINFKTFFDIVSPTLQRLPGLIHAHIAQESNGVYSFKKSHPVYLNITPPCDAAQRPQIPNIYLEGTLHTYTSYSKALVSSKRTLEGENIYKTPPAYHEETKRYLVFYFDLKSILRDQAIENLENAVFMLKDSILTELMQKFGHYNSRIGTRTFN